MSASPSEVTILTLLISTALLVFFSVLIIYFLFLYQRKRFRHQQEVLELRETFTETLFQSKLAIREQTLDHIAKELHANFSQLVSLININLSAILPQSSDSVRESIIETKSLAKQLLSDLKALSASLNTDHILHIGFLKAFENELNRLSKSSKYKVTITRTGQLFRLKPEHEIILFRLCQEILNNIIEYAQGNAIAVKLDYEDDRLLLEIADNGVGFDFSESVNRRAEKESTGLLNMEKRAGVINGTLKIESEIGTGTTVSISVPQ